MMEYEIYNTFRGYVIRKPNGKFWLYLSKVYKGKHIWMDDHTYAKHFTLQTAQKHIEMLKAQDAMRRD